MTAQLPLSDNPEEADFEEEAKSLDLWLPPEPDDWSNIGEIEAKNWRDFPEVVTDSLWIIGARSREGVHSGKYHGNFVPQIPYQAIKRFTRPGDVILDTFLGSGTTLIEARRLGRNGIGIELLNHLVGDTRTLIEREENPHATWQEVICGDSTDPKTIAQVRRLLDHHDRDKVQMLIMHPPYHDIIKFSDHSNDLSNAQSIEDFLEAFKQIVHLTYDLLEQNHFLVVVIGDKYSDKEWIPLGFRTMEAVQSVGYALKSIVVKNMEGNRAKRNVQNLWRVRAFKGDWYIFKHEYVFFFQKADRIVAPLEKVADLVLQLDEREKLDLIPSKSSTFATGEALSPYFASGMRYASISAPRILVLKQGGRIRAVVINLMAIELNQTTQSELRDFLNRLPDTVVDVSALAEDHKRGNLQSLGISQVYDCHEQSLEQLAHALYVLRKALGGGQKVGRADAVALVTHLNKTLAAHFDNGSDYVWRKRGQGVGFKFFKRTAEKDYDEREHGRPNFAVGIEAKWINGQEIERAAIIRDNYYQQGFTLIAIVGHKPAKWKAVVQETGHFADYYLMLDKADQTSIGQVLASRPMLKAGGKKTLEKTDLSLIAFLQEQKNRFIEQAA